MLIEIAFGPSDDVTLETDHNGRRVVRLRARPRDDGIIRAAWIRTQAGDDERSPTLSQRALNVGAKGGISLA